MRRAWPIARRAGSTGVRSAPPFWPTSRWSDGCCWRHEDTLVEQRELEQWFLRITNYADELLRDLDKLDRLAGKSPHHAAQLDRPQRRHAGRFQTRRRDGPGESTITVFTTRVDTIYGATSLQLAPEHPLVAELDCQQYRPAARQVDQLIAEQRKAREVGDIGEIEKHGVNTGRYAINPYNGEKVPIWVANYILMDYGTGAIMSVPAHDERDYEFAKKYKTRNSAGDPALATAIREETAVEPRASFHHRRWHAGEFRAVQRARLRRSHATRHVRARRRRMASAKPRSPIA